MSNFDQGRANPYISFMYCSSLKTANTFAGIWKGRFVTSLWKAHLFLGILMIVLSFFFHSCMELSLTSNILAEARFRFSFENCITTILKPELSLLHFAGSIFPTDMDTMNFIEYGEHKMSQAPSDRFQDKSSTSYVT
ncbi:hypothetical protein CDAR_500021 [Caerostris darwini]|uniref:Uncharacterized protein n=1 Tax=Caerostris darwini TaxID=1538125 RepID=A0AAV4PQ26_9ARAC|nr:hypothetical protein CDAR_500021 [Caerostris darwini]